jgi:hypothetical protein
MEKVGPPHVVASRIPWIQIDATKVDEPQERGQMLDDWKIDYVSRAVFDGTNGKPVGSRSWRALHEEKVGSDPVWVSLHDHGAVTQMRQHPSRDVGVVLEQIALDQLELWKENFAEVREVYFAAVNFQIAFVGVVGDIDG